MSGLFIKDCALLMERKSSLGILFIVGIMMGFTMDGAFVVGYITMLTAILTLSTISLDEYDNGYAFLLTMPITRSMYVKSKYIFSAIVGLIGFVFAMVVYVGCSFVRNIHLTGMDYASAFVFIPFFLLVVSVMMPLQMKYGAEGSRIVLAIIAGIIAVIVFCSMNLFPEGIEPLAFLNNLSNAVVIIAFVVITLIAICVSYICSCRVMNKKTF